MSQTEKRIKNIRATAMLLAMPLTFACALALTIILLGSGASRAQAQQQATVIPDNGIHVLPVQGNVYMLVGDGANVTVQIGSDGVLLVDAGTGAMSEKLLATIHALSDAPIRYLIDTTDDPDHIGGNEAIAKAGRTIAGGNVVGNIGESAGNTAAVISFEGLNTRMSEAKPALPSAALPTDTYSSAQKNLWFNGESIRVFHQPAAHTDSDSIVYFRRSDVISAGDIFRTDTYPMIDLARGGSLQGVIDGLNHLIDLTIPADDKSKDEGGTMVIPGHGRLCDQADVVVYQEMLTIIRDRLKDMIGKGMTLEQVKAAQPTRDYDARYGATSGPWTTDMFIEAAYKSMSAKH